MAESSTETILIHTRGPNHPPVLAIASPFPRCRPCAVLGPDDFNYRRVQTYAGPAVVDMLYASSNGQRG